MAMKKRKILIVGCGPGGPEYVTPAAREAVARAELLVGAPRLFELFPESGADRCPVGADVSAALEAIAEGAKDRQVVVLVTGDPGLRSLAQPVIQRFGREACEVIPGISSPSVAFARLGLDWTGACMVDAHGRQPDVPDAVLERSDRIAVLAGTTEALRWAAAAAARIRPARRIIVCEDLTLPEERIREVAASELAGLQVSSRTIILLLSDHQPRGTP
jgi:precorrin-6y C5,15-methyltransferase (decarboxylating) CbiE subunit